MHSVEWSLAALQALFCTISLRLQFSRLESTRRILESGQPPPDLVYASGRRSRRRLSIAVGKESSEPSKSCALRFSL